ncbi:YcaO-like family protein [Sinorhizobium americanum]|uniref:Ribosomal protein S12 methylthiotransferase accessory factor n=1 Tax=Sinorhizobium americanum TaxID=194963 RepID=A0A4R2BT01_9HYPH|nr:YcaO-like family protein [Sinorhizobium americanum]TCN29913.1 ribosomal protein S12 methylthiotransferase accessory factor [Sinorhizobium americanum]
MTSLPVTSTLDLPRGRWSGSHHDYSDRVCTPEETFDRVRPFLTTFGVARVARHTGLDKIGIPVWCAYTPNSRSIVVAQGKGLTDADARASAVMEALERAVAGEPDVDMVMETADNLRASHRAFDRLDALIAAGRDDIRPDEAIEWVGGTDLISAHEVLVPLEAVLLDRTRPSRFWMSSDGLASGNTIEEAMLHGLLERVERDAHVLWRVSGEKARHLACVDPETFDDPALGALVSRIEAAGLELRLFDIASDTGIPCFLTLLGPRGTATAGNLRFLEVTSGCGAHPSTVRAAIRAVTEAAQSRLTYIGGARDDVYAETFSRPLPESTRRAFLATPRPIATPLARTSAPVEVLLSHAVSCVKKAGARSVIAVRLSRDDLPFVVVKVLVPDLESPDGERARRFGPRALSKAISS